MQLDQEPWEDRDNWQEQEPGRPRRVPDSRVDGVASAPGATVPPRSLAGGHWAHDKDVAAKASCEECNVKSTAGMRDVGVFELWVDDDVMCAFTPDNNAPAAEIISILYFTLHSLAPSYASSRASSLCPCPTFFQGDEHRDEVLPSVA